MPNSAMLTAPRRLLRRKHHIGVIQFLRVIDRPSIGARAAFQPVQPVGQRVAIVCGQNWNKRQRIHGSIREKRKGEAVER